MVIKSWLAHAPPNRLGSSYELLSTSNGLEITLVFQDSRSYWGWQYLTPQFRHVYALIRHPSLWVLFEPSVDGVRALPLDCPGEIDMTIALKAKNPEIVLLRMLVSNERPGMPSFKFIFLSCVSSIQYLLGIYWPLTVTPWGLYSRLVRDTPAHIRILDDGWKQQESRKGS